MTLRSTAEQAAIIDAVRRQRNIVIQAGAGTGKTSTVVSTAHKAKGREWESVLIADDFAEPTGEDLPRVDAMLGYVAVTRARLRLDRGSLTWIDRFEARRRAG